MITICRLRYLYRIRYVDVYFSSENFLKLPITTCEIYETTAETTTYFFGAKTNNNHTKPLPPPSVTVYAEWLHSITLVAAANLLFYLTILGQPPINQQLYIRSPQTKERLFKCGITA